mgnify:CR=1 FL=1
MNLKHLPDLNQFLSTTIFDADPGSEKAVVESFLKNAKMTLQKLDKMTEGLEDQGPMSVLSIFANAVLKIWSE